MPFYFRDSIKVGPFFFNLSKSGVGLSSGIKGFRLGSGPRGHYIHAGANGIYYRSTLGTKPRKSEGRHHQRSQTPTNPSRSLAPYSADRAPSYVTEDGVVMSRITSGDAEAMKEETRAEAVSDLNRAQGRLSLPMLFGTLGAFFTFIFWLGSLHEAFSVSLVISILTVLIGHHIDRSRRQVVFAYDLDPRAERDFEAIVSALDQINRSSGLWYIDAEGHITNLVAWKRNAGASELVDKNPTQISYHLPPGVQSNITPPSIRIAHQTLYFLPDCILVRENRTYGAVSYADLRVAVRDQRFIVDDPVPSDALVVGETWAHPNKNGGPDRRFRNNRLLTICLFEEIGIIGSTGLKVLLQISKRRTAQPLAKAIEGLAKIGKEDKSKEVVLLSGAE